MNKWWLAGFAFPAIAGMAWIATKGDDNPRSSSRTTIASASPESMALAQSVNSSAIDVPRQTPPNGGASNLEAKPAAPPDEPLSTKDLQELLDKDPAAALLRARKDLARDPKDPDAAERNWVVVKSLAVLGRYEEARVEAKTMVEKFPGTRWANDVERHILAHP